MNKPSDYLPTIEHALNESLAERPGLVIYNAGMELLEGWSTSGMVLIKEEIFREPERMVFGVYRAVVFRSPLPWRWLCGLGLAPEKAWLTFIG